MAAPRARKPTWMEVAVRNAGIRQAIKAFVWAYSWGIARAALGRDPSVEQVAEWWQEPVRTAYREQAAFRSAFPELETPAPLVDIPQVQDSLQQAAKSLQDLGDRRSKARSAESAILQIGLLGPS